MPVLMGAVDLRIRLHINTLYNFIIERTALRLTEAEAMSVLVSDLEQWRAMVAKIDLECFAKRFSHLLSIMAGSYSIEFEFKCRRNAPIIMPTSRDAERVFHSGHANPEMRQRIMETCEAIAPIAQGRWAMYNALDYINRSADEVEQISFYLPWVPKLLELFAAQDGKGEIVWVDHKGVEKRQLRALTRAKSPKRYLTLTSSQREYCRQGNTLLATYNLLRETSTPDKQEVWCEVRAETTAKIESPFD